MNKKTFLSLSLVALGGVLMAPSAKAATVLCTSGITNVVTTLGPGLNSCDVTGALNVLFSNFQVSPTTATVGIDTTSMVVGNEINLGFQLSGVILDASGNFDIHLLYTVTGGISGIDLSFQATNLTGHTGGNVTMTETACTVAFASPTGGCTGTTLASIAAISSGVIPNLATANATFGTTQTVFINKDIQFNGFMAMSEVTNSHLSGVPEPMTLSMMGIGLLSLGLLRRRQAGKK
jgi:hypothetical protein